MTLKDETADGHHSAAPGEIEHVLAPEAPPGIEEIESLPHGEGDRVFASGEPRASEVPTIEPPPPAPEPRAKRPTYVFLGVVAAISLVLDIGSKAWAEVTLNRRGFEPIELIDHHLSITLAYNQGGAWGLFANAGETVRKPFFLIVSAAAIWFIVSLYGRLQTGQKALTWGLPLVLGGALGNLSDRITRSQVVDFIDYRAEWVLHLNSFVHKYVRVWTITDHWPTFNVADVAICIGVGLMAVDMFSSRKRQSTLSSAPPAAPPSRGHEEPVEPTPAVAVD